MKKLLLTLFIAILNICAFAQNGLITGNVIDKTQNLSLPGATLKILPGNRYTISDQSGRFEFLNVPNGEYQIEVSYLGYKKYSQSINLSSKSLSLTIVLEEGVIAGNEVVVLGDRLRGQAKALSQQRSNTNITNIVSSDQIGRFPDANIGDAIKRIPGITMQNDQGEARNIIIRGMAPELNSVTLNGDRIPSAEGDNRRVQMDLIPSDMIQTIEVNKTLTPDMDADAIGGSVNLITRAAPNVQRISFTAASGYSPIRDKATYTGALVYGNRFIKNKLGVVLSASYNDNNFGSDNIEAVWAKDDFDNVFVEEHDIRKYDVQRIRRSFSLSSDYKFNAKNNISFSGMYNWRDDYENRFRLRYTSIEPVYDTNDLIVGYEGRARRETKGGIDNDKVKAKRLERQEVKNFALKGEHLLSPKLDFDWAASYSDASEKRPNERYMQFQTGRRDIILDLADSELPAVTSTGIANSNFSLRDLTENNDFTKESEMGYRINFRTPLSLINNQKGRLKFGARLRIKEKERLNNFIAYEPINAFGNLSTLPTITFNNALVQGPQFAPGTFVDKKYLGGLNLNDASLFNAEEAPEEFLALNYSAKEAISAGYIRYDQDINEQLSFIAGIRLENTNINYTGNIVEDEEDLQGQRTLKNDYLNVLPSLTLKYIIKENLILRAAYTTSLARPNYYDLVPYFNSLPSDEELNVGNSNLKAATANNFDFLIEKYFKSVGIISGGAFYKNINNFIYTYRDAQYTTSKFAADFPDENNPINTGANWTFTQRRNGEAVKVYGFEIAFQRQLDFLPGFLKGFGIYTNYTFTKSKAEGVFNADGDLRSGVPLPGTAPNLFNASLSYETKKLVARLSYNFSDAYLDELGGEGFEDRFYDKQSFLDANASYKITNKIRLFGEANNLTNQALRYYQGVAARTAQLEYYRPRYTFGLKYDL
ncbi:TonB-dependent receptor [Pedobacter puniceum]|jgi:TonB-dependent receptor|uniref:TonB-dependent receptor n=1 Tax=Pedobacter puniceum TaxID=2666136 RepID=A0A7K0FQE3_9SPHI|nr:TonB-dependent receptor [Pedobacter puniceum]MRX47267.1 TonB-dependent receptor [Pedobacter puniceum]